MAPSVQVAALEDKKRRQIEEAKREAASAESGSPGNHRKSSMLGTFTWTQGLRIHNIYIYPKDAEKSLIFMVNLGAKVGNLWLIYGNLPTFRSFFMAIQVPSNHSQKVSQDP